VGWGRRIGAAALATLSACAGVDPTGWWALRTETARIAAAGEPTSFDQLRAVAVDSETGSDEDAGPDYRTAIGLSCDMDEVPVDRLLKTYRDGARACPPAAPNDSVRADTRRILAEAQPLLEVLDRAAEKRFCHHVFDVDAARFPKFQAFRNASALLSLRTVDLAMAGDGDRAVFSLVSALRFLRALEAEPVLIAHLVRLANAGRASNDLDAILGATPSEASLRTLAAALRRAEAPYLMRRAFLGERIWLIGLARQSGGERFWQDWEARRKIARDIGAMAPAIQAAGDPWPAVLSSVPAAAPDDQAAIWSRTTERTASIVALMRAGRVATLVELYRRRHGALPSDLAEVAASSGQPLPVNPYTGDALVYRRSDDRFSIDAHHVCLSARPSASDRGIRD
jgi:hypothetical protein